MSSIDMNGIESRVYKELRNVLDPCSTFTDNPINIVDMGIVDDVGVDGTAVNIDLLPTNQMCMYMMNMSDEIQERLSDLEGVDDVTVNQVYDKIWTQQRMSGESFDDRQEYFRERAREHGLTPYYGDEADQS